MQEHHSTTALAVSLAGLALEAMGGLLLAMEDLYKYEDLQKLKNALNVVNHPAMKGITWLETHGIVLYPGDDPDKKLEELPIKHNQSVARLGFWLLFSGILLHGFERVLSYAGIAGF